MGRACSKDEWIGWQRALADRIVARFPREWLASPDHGIEFGRIFPIVMTHSLDSRNSQRHSAERSWGLGQPGAYLEQGVADGLLPFEGMWRVGQLGPEGHRMRKRFFQAHEIVHWAIQREFYPNLPDQYRMDRRFLDSVALRVLLPDVALRHLCAQDFEPNFDNETIDWLTRVEATFGISFRLLVLRLAQAIAEGIVETRRLVLLVRTCRSGKGRPPEAPRIDSCCTPAAWFLPWRRRLTSLGLRNADRIFREAPVGSRGHVEDVITARSTATGLHETFPVNGEYLLVRWPVGRLMILALCRSDS